MKPSDLRALLEKASPRPWHCVDYDVAADVRDIETQRDGSTLTTLAEWMPTNNADAIVALVNLAPLLIELWERTIRIAEDEDPPNWINVYVTLTKLEES